mgnify:CR=1 FL=1
MTEVIHLIDRNNKNFPNTVCGATSFRSTCTDQITLTTCERCLKSMEVFEKFKTVRMKKNLGQGQHKINKRNTK